MSVLSLCMCDIVQFYFPLLKYEQHNALITLRFSTNVD